MPNAMPHPDPFEWHIWFDGSASPNPGRIGLGVLAVGPDGQRKEYSGIAAEGGCNNEAELLALGKALEMARASGARRVLLQGDSDFAHRAPVTAPSALPSPIQACSLPAPHRFAVTANNDAPVNSIPLSTQQLIQMNSLAFNTARGNLISVCDVDAGPNPLQVTLTAAHGTLTLSGVAGLGFTEGDGTTDTTITFTGTSTALNAALDGLTDAPTPGYNGDDIIQIVTDDMGNSGSGGHYSQYCLCVVEYAPSPRCRRRRYHERN